MFARVAFTVQLLRNLGYLRTKNRKTIVLKKIIIYLHFNTEYDMYIKSCSRISIYVHILPQFEDYIQI